MDPAATASVVAVTLSVLAGIGGAYATLRQRKTEDVGQVLNAQHLHMQTLTDENKDLRNRLTEYEKQVLRLREDVWNCDREKNQLKDRVTELERLVSGH